MATITGNNSNNTINGTGQDDVIYGLDGNDNLNGGNGDDALYGGDGNDTLTGGNGADLLVGGTGNDVYIIDANDTLVELAGEGIDEVRTYGSYTLLDNFEVLKLIGTANVNATGNSADNLIAGNSANNILDGAGGTDSMYGGAGNDIYITDGGDNLVEYSNQGIDEVRASVSYTLGTNFENLTLTGTSNINATGNTVANVITGNSGNNTLDGGLGIDTLSGGDGNDVYITDGADNLTEAANNGVDDVRSSATFSLAANFETLTLTGTANINGTGNSGNNTIAGNTGNNFLDGGAGIDTLQMTRPAVSNYLTSVNLTTGVALGNGTDTVVNFENVRGTEMTDYITGDAGNNVIDGAGGHDEIFATLGVDTIIGGDGQDAVQFGGTGAVNANLAAGTYVLDANNYGTISSVQHLVGSNFGDVLVGDGLRNNMSGGAGADIMTGGGGDDQIWAGAGSDTLIADFGNDTLVGNRDYNGNYGDAASDTFRVMSTAGNVTIADFKLGVDKLDLTDFGFDANGVSPNWSGQAVQSGSDTLLTLTSLSNQVVTIRLQGVVEGYKLAPSDMINGSNSLIAPPPSYPINGGNGAQDNFLIDPLDIINNHGGSLVIPHFENGLDHLDVQSMNLLNGGYWGGFLANAPGNTDAILNFEGLNGEHFTVTLTGVPYWQIDQSDYVL